MANDRNLINAFDDAIERLSNGEKLDSVLQDYPDYADYLSDLLMISERVAEVHSEDDEAVSARSRGRDKLQQALQEKPKRRQRSRLRSYGPWAAAATIVIMFGFGFLMLTLTSGSSEDPALVATKTAIAQANSTTYLLIQGTQAQSTQVAMSLPTSSPVGTQAPPTQLLINASATPSPYVENFDITATAIAPNMIVTSVASMPQATVPPPLINEYAITATALINLLTQDASIIATDQARNQGMGLISTPSPSGGNSDGDLSGAIKTTSMPVQATSTPLPSQTAIPTQNPAVYPVGTVIADASLVIPEPVSENIVPPPPLPDLIDLSAGEIDDNADWDRYLLYRRNFLAQNIPVYDIDITGRQIITVVDSNNRPILGAKVTIIDTNGRGAEHHLTYADGRTLFFPNANEIAKTQTEFFVTIEKDDLTASFVLDRNQSSEWTAVLDGNVTPKPIQLDVLFLIDTTGSMEDEINQLQNNILHISSEIDNYSNDVDVRYGLVIYREHNNWEYVTRRFAFTSDVSQFQADLNTVTANGDGNTDWDEPLNVGLDQSLNMMSWRGEDTIKLIFLVADARPHIDHPLEPITYDQSIQTALSRGIKIHPIASSGLEPAGEFIFRQIAQVTMGHFLFLTYDEGVVGTAGDARPDLNVGQPESEDPIKGYTVDSLSDLVLRLIQDELLSYISPLPAEPTGEINEN